MSILNLSRPIAMNTSFTRRKYFDVLVAISRRESWDWPERWERSMDIPANTALFSFVTAKVVLRRSSQRDENMCALSSFIFGSCKIK